MTLRYRTVLRRERYCTVYGTVADTAQMDRRDETVGSGSMSRAALALVYPNSGEVWDASEGQRRWKQGTNDSDVMPVLNGSHALSFRDAGAALIGGCCRVTADQIGLFSAALKSF